MCGIYVFVLLFHSLLILLMNGLSGYRTKLTHTKIYVHNESTVQWNVQWIRQLKICSGNELTWQWPDLHLFAFLPHFFFAHQILDFFMALWAAHCLHRSNVNYFSLKSFIDRYVFYSFFCVFLYFQLVRCPIHRKNAMQRRHVSVKHDTIPRRQCMALA